MDFFGTVVRFFQEGGAFMYPIVVILLAGLAISLERWLFLARSHRESRDLWSELLPTMNQGNFGAAIEQANASDTAIGRVLGNGLSLSLIHI